MIEVLSTQVSEDLLKLLFSEEEYEVHSSFSNGFNLKIGDCLSFIGNKDNTKIPYGVLIKDDKVSEVIDVINKNETIFKWDSYAGKLVSKELVINLFCGKSYNSSFHKTDTPINDEQIKLLMKLIDVKLYTGFDATIEELLQQDESINELYNSFSSNDTEVVRNLLKKWIGKGRGLTPSGDDFLQGILVVNYFHPMLSELFCNEILNLVMSGYTTDISKSYFLSALQGLFVEPIKILYEALKENDLPLLQNSIHRILNFGHTSGSDIVAGIFVGLRYIERNYM